MESNFKALFSCQTVKDFSCFWLDVESLVTYSDNKKADFQIMIYCCLPRFTSYFRTLTFNLA